MNKKEQGLLQQYVHDTQNSRLATHFFWDKPQLLDTGSDLFTYNSGELPAGIDIQQRPFVLSLRVQQRILELGLQETDIADLYLRDRLSHVNSLYLQQLLENLGGQEQYYLESLLNGQKVADMQRGQESLQERYYDIDNLVGYANLSYDFNHAIQFIQSFNPEVQRFIKAAHPYVIDRLNRHDVIKGATLEYEYLSNQIGGNPQGLQNLHQQMQQEMPYIKPSTNEAGYKIAPYARTLIQLGEESNLQLSSFLTDREIHILNYLIQHDGYDLLHSFHSAGNQVGVVHKRVEAAVREMMILSQELSARKKRWISVHGEQLRSSSFVYQLYNYKEQYDNGTLSSFTLAGMSKREFELFMKMTTANADGRYLIGSDVGGDTNRSIIMYLLNTLEKGNDNIVYEYYSNIQTFLPKIVSRKHRNLFSAISSLIEMGNPLSTEYGRVATSSIALLLEKHYGIKVSNLTISQLYNEYMVDSQAELNTLSYAGLDNIFQQITQRLYPRNFALKYKIPVKDIYWSMALHNKQWPHPIFDRETVNEWLVEAQSREIDIADIARRYDMPLTIIIQTLSQYGLVWPHYDSSNKNMVDAWMQEKELNPRLLRSTLEKVYGQTRDKIIYAMEKYHYKWPQFTFKPPKDEVVKWIEEKRRKPALSQSDIASRYGVDQTQISYLIMEYGLKWH
ncbi:MAG: hypothetical protein ACEQSA_01190 [Weeksellaceae bacterium]